MRISRKGGNRGDDESDDEEGATKRRRTNDQDHLETRARRREANVDDELEKARVRAARLKQAHQQQLSTQQAASRESSATVQAMTPKAVSGTTKQIHNASSELARGSDSNENSKTVPPTRNTGSNRVSTNKASPSVGQRSIAMNAASSSTVDQPPVASSSTVPPTADQAKPKLAPFVFRKPTVIKGPSQKEYSVYFTEPQFEDNTTSRTPLKEQTPSQGNRHVNADTWSRQREEQGTTQVAGPLYGSFDEGATSYGSGRQTYATPQKQSGRRGGWRGGYRGYRGPMKKASVGMRRGATRQTLLSLRPLPDENTPYDQVPSSPHTFNSHPQSSPSVYRAESSQPYTPSRRHPSTQQRSLQEPTRNFNSSSSISMVSAHSRVSYNNSSTREQLPRPSEIRQALVQEAASDFSYGRACNGNDSLNYQAPASSTISQGMDRRTAQYGNTFTSDPAQELRHTQNRIASFGWNTKDSSKLLKAATQRAQVPSTPSQGHASKNRRGRFDPTTLHSSSSTTHASSSRLPAASSSASWSSSQVHGANGTRQDTIVIVDSDDDFDDGGLQDEDFAQLDVDDF